MSDSDSSLLPQEVVEAFTTAAITALQELTQTEAYAQPSFQALMADTGNVVLATLRLMRTLPGKLTLILTVETAARLATRYLPPGTTLSEEMVDDVVGEFANVIAGQSKTMLKGTHYHFTLSTPVVTRMASFAHFTQITTETLVAELACEWGQLLLFVDLCPCPGS